MGVEVLSKLRQALTQHVSGSSLAGDGMLVRIRTTSIALLGIVTAIGLGLVVFISQQGWPEVFSGPIPAAPQSAVVHNDTIEASPAGSGVSTAGSQRAGDPSSSSSSRGSSRGGADSGLAGSRQVGDVSPAADAAPGASQPAPSPSPAPPAEPAPVPVAAPAPAPVPTAPPSGTATGGGAQSAGSGSGGAAEGKEKGEKWNSGHSRGTSPAPSGGQVSKGGSRSQSPSRSQAPQQKEAAPPAPEYQAPPPPPPPPPSEAAGEGSGSSGSKGTVKTGRIRQ